MRSITRSAALSLAVVALTSCGGSSSPSAPTPPGSDFAAQFDSLWNTFDQQYSYFDYKHIDWNALRDRFRPMAIAAGDQTSFINVVRQMLSALHDQHVVIRNPAGAVTPTYDPGYFVNWDRTVWLQYLNRGTWTPGRGDWGHGTLNGTAYIQIGAWNSGTLSANEFDAAFENYRNAPRLILDVRMNGGGDDQIAFQVAGRFATSSVTTGYVKTRTGAGQSDFGPLTARTLSPRGPWQYTSPVLLLIGRHCLSSNESFISAMRQLPNVTVVGDRTGGGSGNPATFPLAGGWSYTVSRWIEYTADHEVIEDVGIAPQVFVPASPADFAQGRDPVLDWALSSGAAATSANRREERRVQALERHAVGVLALDENSETVRAGGKTRHVETVTGLDRKLRGSPEFAADERRLDFRRLAGDVDLHGVLDTGSWNRAERRAAGRRELHLRWASWRHWTEIENSTLSTDESIGMRSSCSPALRDPASL